MFNISVLAAIFSFIYSPVAENSKAGSGRKPGVRAMKKLFFGYVLTMCLALAANAYAATVNTYDGFWYDTAKSAQGLQLEQQGANVMVIWYTYGTSGAPIWLLMDGNLSGTTISGPIYYYTGSPFGPNYNPALAAGTVLGTWSLNFTDANNSIFTYTVSGVSGTLNLVRYSHGTIPLAGTYLGGRTHVTSTCSFSPAGSYAAKTWTVTQSGSVLTVTNGGECTYSGPIQQIGAKFLFQPTISCSSGLSGTGSFEIKATDDALAFTGTDNFTAGTGAPCQRATVGGGIKLN